MAEAEHKSSSIDWKEELRTWRICAQIIYSNSSNRRQAEQVEAALQEWDLTQNQRQAMADGRRFSLHQRSAKNFSAKPCAGHVLLVEVTKAFFTQHPKAVFLLRESGVRVGEGGKVL